MKSWAHLLSESTSAAGPVPTGLLPLLLVVLPAIQKHPTVLCTVPGLSPAPTITGSPFARHDGLS